MIRASLAMLFFAIIVMFVCLQVKIICSFLSESIHLFLHRMSSTNAYLHTFFMSYVSNNRFCIGIVSSREAGVDAPHPSLGSHR